MGPRIAPSRVAYGSLQLTDSRRAGCSTHQNPATVRIVRKMFTHPSSPGGRRQSQKAYGRRLAGVLPLEMRKRIHLPTLRSLSLWREAHRSSRTRDPGPQSSPACRSVARLRRWRCLLRSRPDPDFGRTRQPRVSGGRRNGSHPPRRDPPRPWLAQAGRVRAPRKLTA